MYACACLQFPLELLLHIVRRLPELVCGPLQVDARAAGRDAAAAGAATSGLVGQRAAALGLSLHVCSQGGGGRGSRRSGQREGSMRAA